VLKKANRRLDSSRTLHVGPDELGQAAAECGDDAETVRDQPQQDHDVPGGWQRQECANGAGQWDPGSIPPGSTKRTESGTQTEKAQVRNRLEPLL